MVFTCRAQGCLCVSRRASGYPRSMMRDGIPESPVGMDLIYWHRNYKEEAEETSQSHRTVQRSPHPLRATGSQDGAIQNIFLLLGSYANHPRSRAFSWMQSQRPEREALHFTLYALCFKQKWCNRKTASQFKVPSRSQFSLTASPYPNRNAKVGQLLLLWIFRTKPFPLIKNMARW